MTDTASATPSVTSGTGTGGATASASGSSIGFRNTESGTGSIASSAGGESGVSAAGGDGKPDKTLADLDNRAVGEAWGNKASYILTLVGYAVGFGNIWRFPYLCQKNGGIAFLIPYSLFLFMAGIPIFFLELAVGQRMRKGPIGSWNDIFPLFAGLGLAAGFESIIIEIYYNTLLAWCIAYFFRSFSFPKLPWQECEKTTTINEYYFYNQSKLRFYNQTHTHLGSNLGMDSSQTFGEQEYINMSLPNLECELAGSVKYFWYREHLNITSDIQEFGEWNWYMTLWIVISWVLTYLCMFKGTVSIGKIVYFTVLFPYLVLIIFFVAGFFLDDVGDGLKILYSPQWERLQDGKVWLDAGTQIFYSLGPASGSLITLASYLPYDNNIYFESYFVPVVNCLTSLFSSVVIFMILGAKGMKEYKDCEHVRNETIYSLIDVNEILRPYTKDHWKLKRINFPHDHFISKLNVTLSNGTSEIIRPLWGSVNNENNLIYAQYCDKEKIVRNTGEGTGMVFITFTEAVLELPGSQFWAIIFFLMMITLGIDSAFTTVECVISCITDFNIYKGKRWLLIGVVCFVYMILGIILFSPGFGLYVLTFMDEMCTGWPLMIIALGECICISYFYGLKTFTYEIKLMTGRRPNSYWLLCWRFMTPIAILTIVVYSIIQFAHGIYYPIWRADLGMNVYVTWPTALLVIGILLCIIPIMAIPGVGILAYCGIFIVKYDPKKFPEEQLRFDKHYSEEEDQRSTSSLQRIAMADGVVDIVSEFKQRRKWSKKSGDNEDDEDGGGSSTEIETVAT